MRLPPVHRRLHRSVRREASKPRDIGSAPASVFRSGGRALLHYADRAAPGGRPLVLVHGVGLGAVSLGRLAVRLERSRAVGRVELPGFGRSPAQPVVPTMREHAELLGAFIRARFDAPVDLLGHSMGTAVAVSLALLDATLVDRLVLVGPVTDPRARTTWRQGVRLLRDTFREPLSTNAVVALEYARCGPKRYLESLPDMLRFDLDDAAPRVPHRTLLIRGANDPISPQRWCRSLADRFPDGRLEEVPGAAHLALHTDPSAVAALVDRFLADGPAR